MKDKVIKIKITDSLKPKSNIDYSYIETEEYKNLRAYRPNRYTLNSAKAYAIISSNREEYIRFLKDIEKEIVEIVKSQGKPIDEIMEDIMEHRKHNI